MSKHACYGAYILGFAGFWCPALADDRMSRGPDSAVVFVVFAVLSFTFLAQLCRVQYKANTRKGPDQSLDTLTIAAGAGHAASASAVVRSALPELRGTSKGREVNNLWHLHSWARLFLSNDHRLRSCPHPSDTHMVMYSFLHVVSAMLVATALYASTEPNDDFCYERLTESDCLAEHTVFTRLTSRCHWSDSSGCSFRRLRDSMVDIFFAALVVCFCCAAAMGPLSYATTIVCSAVVKPTTRAAGPIHKPKALPQSHLGLCRRVSADDTSSGPLSDFDTINNGILRQKNALTNGVIRNQFCTAWGVSSISNTQSPPLPKPWPQGIRPKDLSAEQLSSNNIYRYIIDAHRRASAAEEDISTALSVPESVFGDAYTDAVIIQLLLEDLLPHREAALVRSSIQRYAPPLVVIRYRLSQPAVSTALLLYICGTGAFVLIFAFERMYLLQLQWLVTLVLWWAIDACVLQPMMLVIQGYLVPLMAKEHFYKAQDIIIKNLFWLDREECAHAYDEFLDEMPSLPPLGDDSAQHSEERHLGLFFFASALVARRSRAGTRTLDLVNKFSSAYPRFLLLNSQIDDETWFCGCVHVSRAALLAVLVFFETLPLGLPDLILRVLLVGSIWILYYAHLALYTSSVSSGVWAPSAATFVIVVAYVLFVLFASLGQPATDFAPPIQADQSADRHKAASWPQGLSDEARHAEEVRPVLKNSVAATVADAPADDDVLVSEFFDNEKSYSIIPSFSQATSVTIDYKDDAEIDKDEGYISEEFDRDDRSYTVGIDVSNCTSRTSISIDVEPEIVNRRKQSMLEASKIGLPGTVLADNVTKFPVRDYEPLTGEERADLVCTFTEEHTEEHAAEDDDMSYTIIRHNTSMTEFTLCYEDEDGQDVGDDKSYTVDFSSRHSSEMSLTVVGENESSEVELEHFGDQPRLPSRQMYAIEDESRLSMQAMIVEEIETFPVRQYAPNSSVRFSRATRMDITAEASRISGSSVAVNMEVSTEVTENFDSQSDIDDDGSVFSVAVVAHENKHVALDEDSKPRVTFSMADVQEEAPKKRSSPRKLPAVAYLSPNRVAPKPVPIPEKKHKPLYEIYGGKKRKIKRKKQDVLRERLNARLARETEIREARERLEVELHSTKKASPNRSPGAEYENESFELSIRVSSPRTQKRPVATRRVLAEGSVQSVDTEPGVEAVSSEISVATESVPSITGRDGAVDLRLTPITEAGEQEKLPQTPPVTSKISFFKKLWTRSASPKGTKGSGRKVVPAKHSADQEQQTPKRRFGAKVSWDSIRRKFGGRSIKKSEFNEEKDSAADNFNKTPAKDIRFEPEYVTPSGRNRGNDAHSTVKAHTDPVKKTHGKIYQSRISWNVIKRRLMKGRESKSPKKVHFQPIEVSADDSVVLQPSVQSNDKSSFAVKKEQKSPLQMQWKPVGKNAYGGNSSSWQNLKTRINNMRKKVV